MGNQRTLSKSDLNDFRDECFKTATEHGWHEKERTVGEFLMLMVTELAEAMEEYRNNKEISEVYVVDSKPEGIPIELADVIIRIMDFCGLHDIDIDLAVKVKMAYNETRPYRHGGKAV